MVESQSTALTTWLHPPEIENIFKNQNTYLFSIKIMELVKYFGADSGNRTRTSCLEGKGTTTMQYPQKYFI
jgi:hypothetical protein